MLAFSWNKVSIFILVLLVSSLQRFRRHWERAGTRNRITDRREACHTHRIRWIGDYKSWQELGSSSATRKSFFSFCFFRTTWASDGQSRKEGSLKVYDIKVVKFQYIIYITNESWDYDMRGNWFMVKFVLFGCLI